MPRTEVVSYRHPSGEAPVVEWLRALRRNDRRDFAKCVAAVGRLAREGHELRRPAADSLERGIHELRVRSGRVNYRILCFFHGKNIAVLDHAFTKEGRLARVDVERALRRKTSFESDPMAHTYEGSVD